jgi:CheY-like chemotaxis protein
MGGYMRRLFYTTNPSPSGAARGRRSLPTSVALRAPSVSGERKAKPDRSCAIKTGQLDKLRTPTSGVYGSQVWHSATPGWHRGFVPWPSKLETYLECVAYRDWKQDCPSECRKRATLECASVTKVLVVDDDRESRELLSEVLTTNGYAVGLVESGGAAQALLDDDNDYAIVIADLRMPDGSGLELLRELRRRKSKREVILMSSFISGSERELALELGADALLEKPFRLSELLEVVAGLAKGRSIGISS